MSVASLNHGRQPQIFGIEGYKIPLKTQLYTTKEYRIPKAKWKSVFAECENRGKEPGPTSYAETPAQVNKRYWTKASGRFRKGKRCTSTEEVMKLSKGKPGPGAYGKIAKGKQPPPAKAPLGLFTKTEGLDFLSSCQSLSEDCPGVGHYFKTEEARLKAYSQVEERTRVYKYTDAKPSLKPNNVQVGPGYLKDLEKVYEKEVTVKATPKHQFGKARPCSAFTQRAAVTKFVPGVGHYKEIEKAYTSHSVAPKHRVAYISKYKDRRFTEAVTHEKKWVPGPGSYDILPPPRTKSG